MKRAVRSWANVLCGEGLARAPDGYAMLMRPNKAETAVHGCHCPGDMAVRMRQGLARPWVGVRVCHLLLLLLSFICVKIQ